MGHHEKQVKAYILLTIVCSSSILQALAAPPPPNSQHGQGRKFAVKHNNPKKVHYSKSASSLAADPQPEKAGKAVSEPLPQGLGQDGPEGQFSRPQGPFGPGGDEMNLMWTMAQPMIRALRTMLAGGPGGDPNELGGNELTAAEKKDGQGTTPFFTWGQLIGYGLKLMLAAMSGGSDGIDREDKDPNPMKGVLRTLIAVVTGAEDPNADSSSQTKELVNFVFTLMKALQSSMNQRSMRARSLGQKDRITDVTLATIDMGKAYVRTFNTTDDVCRQQMMCEAARECVKDVGMPNAHGICHFTAMAAANLMYYTQTSKGGDKTKLFLEAARKGRSQENCKSLFVCNETH